MMRVWKKTIFALLGVMVLLGSAMTVSAEADSTAVYCPHCEENVVFTDWDGKAPKASCHVRLPQNGLTIDSGTGLGLSSGVTMVLDLNGQTLARETSEASKLFLVNSGAKLVIMDSSEDKTGTIIGKQNNKHGGVAQVYGGDLDIYGGTFKMVDGSVTENGGLFLISTNKTAPTVNIYGGTFYGTTAEQGGVLQFGGNELRIFGGTFYAGSATKGDSLYLSSGKATIENAVIEGGVQVSSNAALTVSGKTVIQKTEGGSAYSLKLPAGKQITADALEEPARIGVTLVADGIFTTDFADAAAAEAAMGFFVLEDTSKELAVSGKALKISAPGTEYCRHCNTFVMFDTTWDGSTVPEAGHYKLTGQTVLSGCKTLAKNSGDVVIDLNGQTMKLADGKNKMFIIYNGAKLAIQDSSETQTGTVISYQKADYHAGWAQVLGGGVDIYGGTFRMTDNSVVKNGGLIYAYSNDSVSPEINIHGGTFYGASAVNGGILYMTSGELNVEGGTFYPGTASTAGDGIYLNGSTVEMTISGSPVIYGGLYAKSVKSLKISGSPVIKKASGGSSYSLKLGSDEYITAGQLEEGTLIGLNHYNNNSVQVKGFDTAADAVKAIQYIIPETSSRMLYANHNTLYITAKSTATTFECEHCDETVEWKVWDGTTKPTAGHYYLNKHTEMTLNASLTDAGDIVLNLNGYTLTKKNAGRMFLVQSGTHLSIMDSSANKTGALLSNGIDNHGMIVNAYNSADAVATIYGGNFYDGSATPARNGALLSASSGGVLIVKGGQFLGGTATQGGAAAVTSGGTLEITGGIFTPGTVTGKGETIFASGTGAKITIGGDAFIQGGAYIGNVESFTLSGSPVISYDVQGDVGYSLKTATPADATGLRQGAHIRVTLLDDEHPTFTTAFADEAAAKAAAVYFGADLSPAQTIQLSGTALTCGAVVEGEAALNDPANDDALNILMVGNSFCSYYVQELYGLLMEKLPENITEVNVYNLYYSGRNLTAHLDRWESSKGDYELRKTNGEGRANLTPVEFWSLEMALAQENWDFISLQGASTGYSYADESQWDYSKELIARDAAPLLNRMYEMFPNTQLLWHRTWAFEVGRISGSTVYDEALNVAYDKGMQEICTWMTTVFDQDKPYDLKMVNSGLAWKYAREENAKLDTSLFPVGGLCARTGVANSGTYQYVKDHPNAENVGDAYHDGDIGGGQMLNAYMWYMTITGDGDLTDNTYAPSETGMPGEPNPYTLADDHLALLKNAAMTAYAETYGGSSEEETVIGDVNSDGSVTDADAMYLLRYTLFPERYPISGNVDFNTDGTISDADAMYLLRYTLFPDRYPLKKTA